MLGEAISLKRNGILHPELAKAVASLGQGDLIMITDAGFPIPEGVKRIDVAVAPNIPRFLDVLSVILTEVVVEEVYVAHETLEKNPDIHEGIMRLLYRYQLNARMKEVSHEQLKEIARKAKFIVRTGEFTPYSNIALLCGTPF